MIEPAKLIEQFLEKNGLAETLKAFKAESKRSGVPTKANLASLANINKLSIPND